MATKIRGASTLSITLLETNYANYIVLFGYHGDML